MHAQNDCVPSIKSPSPPLCVLTIAEHNLVPRLLPAFWLYLTHAENCHLFSGYSVGFCINEEKVTGYQLELGK